MSRFRPLLSRLQPVPVRQVRAQALRLRPVRVQPPRLQQVPVRLVQVQVQVQVQLQRPARRLARFAPHRFPPLPLASPRS